MAQDTECSYRDGYRTGRLHGQSDPSQSSVCVCVCVTGGGVWSVPTQRYTETPGASRHRQCHTVPARCSKYPGPVAYPPNGLYHIIATVGGPGRCGALARLITASTSTEAPALPVCQRAGQAFSTHGGGLAQMRHF